MSASSLPALVAAKCAERQGDAAFGGLHERLFAAHFRDNLDIGRAASSWSASSTTTRRVTRIGRR